jgi:hypothetical protein
MKKADEGGSYGETVSEHETAIKTKNLPPVTEKSIDELRFKDLPEDSTEDDLYTYLKRRHNKLVDEFHDSAKALNVLQEEIDEELGKLDDTKHKDMGNIASKFIKAQLLKEAIDVSDEVPPMGWNTTEPGVPAGSGAPKPQMQSLQSEEEKEQQKADQGVLYDSTKDSGPQFQTTISPKDKSVTVKFLDSPEQESLHKIVEQKPDVNFDQLPKLNTTPSAGGVQQQQEPGKFQDQEVPVVF